MTKISKLEPSKNNWMKASGIMSVMAAITESGGEARFVGGAVRDALIGREVGDIDLAVNLPPDKVIEALRSAGLKAVPTGIDFGTITAVAEGKGYEITTLRHDVETDGRKAKVAYTDNWQADASRRDFTFNAIYADITGTLYDYFDGIEDLNKGKVRFIGKAESRIREDILRILRYFRFYAWYGEGKPDAEALSSCERMAPLLPQLSAERVWKEIGKLLLAPNAAKSCRLMLENDILKHLLPDAFYIEQFEKLITLESKYATPNNVRRLSALFPADDASFGEKVARFLRMSKKESEKLKMLSILPPKIDDDINATVLRRLLYDYGTENISDALLLATVHGKKINLGSSFETIKNWESPIFPITGKDILTLGVKQSPKMGEILKLVEGWWKDKDFKPNRDECLEEAKRNI